MRVTNNSNIDTQAVDASAVGRNRKAERAKANQAAKAEESAAPASFGDTSKVELSSDAKSVAKAAALAKGDGVDQAKIDRIKALINAKQYNPDMGAVADKMVNEHILQELS